MIWLKEEESFVGYVPILQELYSENEIREMSKYSGYSCWSQLSELVMKIQGIEFSYYDGWRRHHRVEAQKLVDIRFGFEFECFLLPRDQMMDKYRRQIFEVFENLTLYKVVEYSEEELKEKIEQAKQTLGQLVSPKTLWGIDYDASVFIRSAEKSSNNLAKLLKMFAEKGYILAHDLFANIDEEITKQISAEREKTTVLEMSKIYWV